MAKKTITQAEWEAGMCVVHPQAKDKAGQEAQMMEEAGDARASSSSTDEIEWDGDPVKDAEKALAMFDEADFSLCREG